jgi:hypothetical protein
VANPVIIVLEAVVKSLFGPVITLLTRIERKVDTIMATVDDLQVQNDRITKGVADVGNKVDALNKTIADLVAAGPGPVSQPQLDALEAQGKAAADALDAVNAK